MVSRPGYQGLGLGLEFFKKVLTTTLVTMETNCYKLSILALYFIVFFYFGM